jgi:DUF971 family protein
VNDAARYEAERVESVESGLVIEWADRHQSLFELLALRQACGCATCGELRGAGSPVAPVPGAPPKLQLLDASLVGSYGVSFTWNDGHSTGIYTWEDLRDGCPCDECRTQRRMEGRMNPLDR